MNREELKKIIKDSDYDPEIIQKSLLRYRGGIIRVLGMLTEETRDEQRNDLAEQILEEMMKKTDYDKINYNQVSDRVTHERGKVKLTEEQKKAWQITRNYFKKNELPVELVNVEFEFFETTANSTLKNFIDIYSSIGGFIASVGTLGWINYFEKTNKLTRPFHQRHWKAMLEDTV